MTAHGIVWYDQDPDWDPDDDLMVEHGGLRYAYCGTEQDPHVYRPRVEQTWRDAELAVHVGEDDYPDVQHVTNDGTHSLCGVSLPTGDEIPSDWFKVMATKEWCEECLSLDH